MLNLQCILKLRGAINLCKGEVTKECIQKKAKYEFGILKYWKRCKYMICVYQVTYVCVACHLYMCVACRLYVCSMSLLCVYHVTYMCVPGHLYVCTMSLICVPCRYQFRLSGQRQHRGPRFHQQSQ